MIIIGIMVIIITTTRLIEFGLKMWLKESIAVTHTVTNKAQACERAHKTDSCL